MRSLPKSGVLRFALIFLVCEVMAWCVLDAWDARHPQYQSTVAFSVINDDTPIGVFGVKTYSFQPDDDDWVLLTHMAAAENGVTRWHLSRPIILGETKNLKDLYRHAERLIMGFLHRYELQEIYYFTVTSDDPTSASQQANQTIQKVEKSMLALFDRQVAIRKNKFFKEASEIVKKLRESGDEPASTLTETNIRAQQQTIVDYIDPLRIFDHAVPNSQRIRTFNYFLTQFVILGLAMVVRVTDWVVTSKFVPSGSLAVV